MRGWMIPAVLGRRAQIETLRYGVSAPATRANGTTTNFTFCPYLPSHQNGTLESVRAFFLTGGAWKIVVLRQVGYTWDRVYMSSSITAASGLNTFGSETFGAVSIQVGDVVGFVGAVGSVAYYDPTGYGCHTVQVSGEPAATGNVLQFSATVRDWQFSYSVRGVCEPSNNLISETFSHTGIPWDWEHAGGAWTYGTGAAVSGTAGLANSLQYRFSIGNLTSWVWSADFTFDTSGARFMMATRNTAQVTAGYAIEINSSTGNMVVYRTGTGNGWSDAGSLTAVDTQATGITFATATQYRMTINKSFRSASVTITDIATPANTFTYAWNQDGSSGSPTRGFGYGKPAFAAISGTVSVLTTTFAVPTAHPDWVFVGDSIMEGSGVTASSLALPSLVAAARGVTIQGSVQGGAGVLHAPTRLASEMPHIRARNIHFAIGTNETNVALWKSRMGGMRDLTTGVSNAYVGSVPAIEANTNPELEFNPYIIAQGWATVRHDLALTSPATGLGVDRNAALYFDTLHPNEAGHAAMAARFAADVP